MNHAEDAEQEALFKWAAYHEELRWMHAIPNGGNRNIREAARLKRQGVKAGVWDIFLPAPRNGYHGLYIEMKNPNGKGRLSVSQKAFGQYIEQEGYMLEVCNTWLEAKTMICEYMGIEA